MVGSRVRRGVRSWWRSEVVGGGVPVAVQAIAEHLLPACAHTRTRIALHTKYWSGV